MKTFVEFLKRSWKVLAFIAGTIFAVLIGRRIARAVISRLTPRVTSPMVFERLDRTHVAVPTQSGWVSVELPKGITSGEVVAVSLTPSGNQALVEVKHEVVDRRARLRDGRPTPAGG